MMQNFLKVVDNVSKIEENLKKNLEEKFTSKIDEKLEHIFRKRDEGIVEKYKEKLTMINI